MKIYRTDKTLIGKDTCISMFIAALFTIANPLKQLVWPSIDDGIKKMCYIYMHTYTYIYVCIYTA